MENVQTFVEVGEESVQEEYQSSSINTPCKEDKTEMRLCVATSKEENLFHSCKMEIKTENIQTFVKTEEEVIQDVCVSTDPPLGVEGTPMVGMHLFPKNLSGEEAHLESEKIITYAESLPSIERVEREKDAFVCGVCYKQFTRRSSYRTHLKIHTCEKPFRCERCGMRFRQKYHLVVHERRAHTGEKPFPCAQCNKRFAVKETMLKHAKKMHAEEKPECENLQAVVESVPTESPCRGTYLTVGGTTIREKKGKPLFPNNPSEGEVCLESEKLLTFGDRCPTEKGNEIDNLFECGVCEKQFSYKGNLKIHMMVHTGDKPYPCESCGKSFRQKYQLIVHERAHTGERPFSCTKCDKRFYTKYSQKKHMTMHVEKSLDCHVCGKTFGARINLDLHLRSHPGAWPFQCGKCGKGFMRKHGFSAHMRTHSTEKSLICIDCGKHFAGEPELKSHMRTHEEKLFSCEECGKRFRLKANLNRHKIIHSEERPYVCGECGKTFRFNAGLYQHVRIHSGEKPFGCEVCGRSFIGQSPLTKHMRTHTGEKPHGCTVCGKRFIQKATLRAHFRTHTGEKPFLCSVCGKGFTVKVEMVKHERRHAIKPHICDKCGEGFDKKLALKRHLKTHKERELCL